MSIAEFNAKFRRALAPRQPNYYTKDEIIALAIILQRHTIHSVRDKINDIQKRMEGINDAYEVATLFKIK